MKTSRLVSVLGWFSFFVLCWLFILGFVNPSPRNVVMGILFMALGALSPSLGLNSFEEEDEEKETPRASV
jgi:hypothetical protein